MFRNNEDMSTGTPGNTTLPTREEHGLHHNSKFHLKGMSSTSGTQQPPSAIQATSPVQRHHIPYGLLSESRTEANRTEYTSTTSSSNQREPVPKLNYPSPTRPSYTSAVTGNQTAATPRSQVLDLKHNDNSFHVIAKLIIDRFEDQLKIHEKTITITAADKYHLDRMVPTKNGFIEAVRWRLQDCPRDSKKPIHIVTRQCRALGLHLPDHQNLLNAPVGTVISIDWSDGSLHSAFTSVQNAKPNSPDDLARQQLLAELREASNLMAESVTPEASKFWRQHVIELQAKLRALHEKGGDSNNLIGHSDAAGLMKNNGRLMASLWQNTGYVPPSQDEMLSTASINNSIVESRAPSVQQNKVNESDPRDMEIPMVDVVAPADLPGDYQFEAEIDSKRFLATVPPGGVMKGETFACYMREMKETDIPVGRWRDGLFDCFSYGPMHPMLLNSVLCPLIALSQVEGRVGLDITGKPAAPNTPRRGLWSTRGMMLTIIVFWVGINALIISGFEFKLHSYVTLSPADIISIVLVNASMIIFTIYATFNTRSFLREKYHIGEGKIPSRREDLLSSIFCLPLSIAQMGRHTTSYKEYEGACCNDTGMIQQGRNTGEFV